MSAREMVAWALVGSLAISLLVFLVGAYRVLRDMFRGW